MEFKEIVKKRYATKMFDGKKVPESKIEELIEIIRMSASSFGIQPYSVKIVTGIDLKKKIQDASYNQAQVSSCSYLFIFCAKADIDAQVKRYKELMGEAKIPKEGIERFGSMVDKFGSNMNYEERLEWAKKQLYIALGNGMNGAKSLGFDSCPMEGFNPREVSKILGLGKNEVPTVLLPVGYAVDEMKKKIRYSREEMFEELG